MFNEDITYSVKSPAFLYDEAGIKNKTNDIRVKLIKTDCGVICL